MPETPEPIGEKTKKKKNNKKPPTPHTGEAQQLAKAEKQTPISPRALETQDITLQEKMWFMPAWLRGPTHLPRLTCLLTISMFHVSLPAFESNSTGKL